MSLFRKVGRVFELRGIVSGPKRFNIDLKHNEDTVALHINPRIENNSLVLNSFEKGQWMKEVGSQIGCPVARI